ncbi:MAG: hypothetical protein HY078_09345 [Elusimicrobia bacterium]|nr:hypothetical protein [Elusimicrobiota bacterium]
MDNRIMKTAALAAVIAFAAAGGASAQDTNARLGNLVSVHGKRIADFAKGCEGGGGWIQAQTTTNGLEAACFKSQFNKFAMDSVSTEKDNYLITPEELLKAKFAVVENEKAHFPLWYYVYNKRPAHLIDLTLAKGQDPLEAIVDKRVYEGLVERVIQDAKAADRAGKTKELSERIRNLGTQFKD